MKTIIVLICLFVIPYVSMDMNAILAEFEKLVKDNEMKINSEKDMDDLFTEYAKQRGEIKEHMAKQAVHELIRAGKLEKGGFKYADSSKEIKLLDNNALDKLAGIVKGNADEANIKKVVQYMEDHNLADIDTQAFFIGYHYAKKNHPEELAALMKDSAAIVERPDSAISADTDMYDTKDTPNHIGYSTVYILVTILIACLLITIGLSFYIVKIAYPYNTYYTIL